MSTPQRTVSTWPAEVAVAALTAVTALTFWRLFVGNSFVVPLVGASLLAHVLCWWMRRSGLPLIVALPLWAVGGVLFVTEAWYRDTTRFLLPTKATWHAAQDHLSAMASSFGSAVAPVVPTTGYLVVAALGLWLVAFATDTLAFRAMGGVEGVLPASVGFVMASALGDGTQMLLATALWAGSAMLVVAMLRAVRAGTSGTWLTTRQSTALGNAARWTAVIGAGAVVAGLVVGPRLPGANAAPLVSTKTAREDATRVTVSPLVDIKSRLSSRSDTVAFRVKSDRPSYMRIAALDGFDGQRWTPSFDYTRATGELEPATLAPYTQQVVQTITIEKLGRVFVPAAFTPVNVQSSRSLQWDASLQTLVVSKGELKAGDTFTITSAVPDTSKLTKAALAAAGDDPPAEIASRFLELPVRTTQRVEPLARQIIADANAVTRYEQVLALQSYFRNNFAYDLTVPAGSGNSAIDSFLNAKRGYCEQFAGTMAAMARSLGIPARVAVGFTQGVREGATTFRIEGKHAHAWPEIYFTGIGWVPFEPTPSRGAPGLTDITNVPAEDVSNPAEAPTAATTLPSIPTPTPSFTLPRTEPSLPDGGPIPTTAPKGGGVPVALLAIIVALVAGGLLLAGWILVVGALYHRRWAKRVAAAATPADRVVVTWQHTLDQLRHAGFRYRPQDTPTEVARRLASTETLRDAGLDRMARHVTLAAYAGIAIDGEVVDEVEQIRHGVEHQLHQVGSRRERLLRRLDPRKLWQRLPGEAETPAD